jgi:hypothetical protein
MPINIYRLAMHPPKRSRSILRYAKRRDSFYRIRLVVVNSCRVPFRVKPEHESAALVHHRSAVHHWFTVRARISYGFYGRQGSAVTGQ